MYQNLLLCLAAFVGAGVSAMASPVPPPSRAAGDLSVSVFSAASFTGVGPGDPLTVLIVYSWDGDGPAPAVRVSSRFSASLLEVRQVTPAASEQGPGTLTWNLGTLNDGAFGVITVTGVVPAEVALGSEIVITASISGDVTDEEPENNEQSTVATVQPPAPDLMVWKLGLLEELEQGLFFTAEEGVPTTFNLHYFNWSAHEAPGTVLTDILPDGVAYLSSEPPPTTVAGQVLTWDLGTLEAYGYGEVVTRVHPTLSGSLNNVASIRTSAEEVNQDNNRAEFAFEVVKLLPPRLLKPNITPGQLESPAIVGRNPVLEGLARAGARVTLYEGSREGCYLDFAGCNPVPLGTATAGPDRRWVIEGALTEPRDYFLYLRAEQDGIQSKAPFEVYTPYVVRIDSLLDKAGFDLSQFEVQTGGQVTRPNALGGQSGTTPGEEWVLKIRQQAPPEITSDPALQSHHDLRLEISGGDGERREMLPPTRIEKVEASAGKDEAAASHFDAWDFIYVHKGFGPGSKVEIWCKPVYYTEDGLPLVGLVYVKCHEILIDPAGYVYDLERAGGTYEWPAVPPDEALITNATVTTMQRRGDDSWGRWEAEKTGQVNPQVTDTATEDGIQVPGYYAFYVPAGQYQVQATAPGYADYTSPILTVVDAPIFHNVGMRGAQRQSTAVEGPGGAPEPDPLPAAAVLYQNYPNPFNPTTVISYMLVAPAVVELTVYNVLGQEVANLVHEVQQPGMQHVQFDAGSLPSGLYVYRLKAGAFTTMRKMTLVR